MIDGLKPYPEFMDSGVPWLGRVPNHWSVLPNRALYSEVKERNHPDEEMLSVTITRGVIRQKALLADSSKKDSSNQDRRAYKLVCPGDIAYNKMRAWQGAVGVSDFRGIISPAYVVMRLRDNHNPRYFHELCRTPHFSKEAERWSYGITSDMWCLRPEHFKMIYSAVPPRDEQDAIVRFLGHANRRIERYIQAKKKLIALLNEQKRAIINQVVTRGLEPNVRFKPSGIPWLGEIPEDWKALQVRRMVTLVTSGSRGWARYYRDEGDIFLQSGNLGRSMSLNLSFIQHVKPPPGSEGVRTRVERDDVLVCITGALTGNVALVDLHLPVPAYVNQHLALIRPKSAMVFPRYLAFALHSEVGRAQFKTSEYGGTKQGLGLDDVKSAIVPLPPPAEQYSICSVLDRRLANFNESITCTDREIALIREHRTRLVADVVTGQLDVRAAAAKLPEHVEEIDPLDEGEMSLESDEALYGSDIEENTLEEQV